jgi:hypothetical protein
MEAFYREGPGGHYENLRGPYTEGGCGLTVTDSRMTLTLILR